MRQEALASLILGMAGLCLGLLTPAQAEVPVPPLKAHVNDLTGTLNAAQRSALETRLADFERQKGSQIAVLIVPTTQPEDIAQYAIRVVEQWQLGRKGVDDGVLVLLAKEDRAVRIEVGYGLEGVLPDVLAKRIIEQDMIPRFRTGDFYGGLSEGVARIIGVINGEPLPAAPEPATLPDELQQILLPALLFAAIVMDMLYRVLGAFVGAVVAGGLVGVAVWFWGAGLMFALIAGVVAFIVTLGRGQGSLGYYGGGRSGSGGGGFSGGGGGFGGGGASGRW